MAAKDLLGAHLLGVVLNAVIPDDIEALKIIAKEYEAKPLSEDDIVIMETSRGTLKIKLYNKVAPNHCYNFKKLANSGFYDETYFHRIIKNFMIHISNNFDLA